MRTMVFYVEKLLQSAKVVVLPENQYMFQSSSSLGKVSQNRTRRAFQSVYCELRQYFEYSVGSARLNG